MTEEESIDHVFLNALLPDIYGAGWRNA